MDLRGSSPTASQVAIYLANGLKAAKERRHDPTDASLRLVFSGSGGVAQETVKRKDAKVGRNDPCPCGSGKKYKKYKKYKKCHGTAA
jgi:preprotein translocase subunit SecA